MLSLILLYSLAVLAVVGDFLYFLLKGRRNTTLSSPGWALFHFAVSVVLLLVGDSREDRERIKYHLSSM